MTSIEKAFWSTSDRDAQIAIAQIASPRQLRALSCRYDWSHHPEAVLGWVMAQKSIDLATALTVFFNGGPERFNYLSKRDVPEQYRCVTRVLDNICLRVNSGYYLVERRRTLRCQDRLDRWLDYQAADRVDARRGRWILDEQIVGALFDLGSRCEQTAPDLHIEKFSDQPGPWLSLVNRIKNMGQIPRRVFSPYTHEDIESGTNKAGR